VRQFFIKVFKPESVKEGDDHIYEFSFLTPDGAKVTSPDACWRVKDVLECKGIADVSRFWVRTKAGLSPDVQVPEDADERATTILLKLWERLTTLPITNYSPVNNEVLDIFVRVNSAGTPPGGQYWGGSHGLRRRRIGAALLVRQLSAPARRLKVLGPELALVEIAATWIADIEGEFNPATLDTFVIYARRFQAFFGSMAGITDAACAQYIRERLRKVKRQTVRKELSALRRFVRWCVQQGVVSREPQIPSPPPRATGTAYFKRLRSKATVITPAEALAIIEALPERSRKPGGKLFPVRPRTRFAWETALRPKTIDNLNVPEPYTRGSATLVVTHEIDKARFGREIPLTEAARAAIDSVCPDVGIIFGRHHCRDRPTRAARSVLPPEKAATFAPFDCGTRARPSGRSQGTWLVSRSCSGTSTSARRTGTQGRMRQRLGRCWG